LKAQLEITKRVDDEQIKSLVSAKSKALKHEKTLEGENISLAKKLKAATS
jgi:hypothetical protein